MGVSVHLENIGTEFWVSVWQYWQYSNFVVIILIYFENDITLQFVLSDLSTAFGHKQKFVTLG